MSSWFRRLFWILIDLVFFYGCLLNMALVCVLRPVLGRFLEPRP